MKKIIVLVTVLVTTLAPLNAIIHTNKTYMSVPTPHYLLPMRYCSWHRIIKQGSSQENPWGTTLQAVPFYRMSTAGTKLGKYFGTNYKNELTYGPPNEGVDLQGGLLIHNYDAPPALKGKLRFNPKRTEYGVYFSLHQELNNINKGLFLQVNIPLEHVEHDLRLCVTGTKHNGKGIRDFLSGNYQETNVTTSNLQSPLCRLKICGARGRSGIADIELVLGYKMADKKEYEACAAIKAIIPTGNKPDSCYLWDAEIGNGRHWGLGASMNGTMSISKSDIHSFECLLGVHFMYLFKADEMRTLGFRNAVAFEPASFDEDMAVVMPWSYYYVGGEAGKAGTFPLANVLTRNLSVQPGSKLQGLASFAYHRNNATFDFGYSFFAQEGEEVSMQECGCWEDNKYAIAAPDYETPESFSFNDEDHFVGGSIKQSELDFTTPATPAVLRHSIHGAFGYTASEWKTPFMMGAGFSIDWTHDNATPIGYTLWAKAGVSF